jgi:two-component system sensor histidine kinase UhpB
VETDTGRRESTQERELREERQLLALAHELQSLTRRLVQAEELERHRIAGELHDRVGQSLSALNINLDVALGLLPKENIEVRMRIADSIALLEGTLQTIEDLMAELRPPLLQEYGLAAALGWYAKQFAKRNAVRVQVDDPEELSHGLSHEVAIGLFRIVQEALANVAKHADAKQVKILLESEGDDFILLVMDNGRGFDSGDRLAQSKRWGMTTMQERAAAIGGRLEVHSTLGGGTSISVRRRR